MKYFEIKAGERVRIIRRFSNSIQATYTFDAEPLNPGEHVSGVVEVSGSNWIFPKPVATQVLADTNAVEKGMWDTLYSVYVIPSSDVRIKLSGAHSSKMWLYVLIAVVIIAIAAAPIVLNFG